MIEKIFSLEEYKNANPEDIIYFSEKIGGTIFCYKTMLFRIKADYVNKTFYIQANFSFSNLFSRLDKKLYNIISNSRISIEKAPEIIELIYLFFQKNDDIINFDTKRLGFSINKNGEYDLKKFEKEIDVIDISYNGEYLCSDGYFREFYLKLQPNFVMKLVKSKLTLEDYKECIDNCINIINNGIIVNGKEYSYIDIRNTSCAKIADTGEYINFNNTNIADFYFYQTDYCNVYFKDKPEGFETIWGNRRRLFDIKKLAICTHCGKYYRINYSCNCRGLDGYHSTSEVFYTEKGKTSKLKLGFEIEKSRQLKGEHILELKKNDWRAENDSSVSGGEYITPVLDIDEVPEYFDKFKFIFEYDVNSYCGGHIHFSEEGVDINKLYKQTSPFRPLLWAIFTSRADNDYCNRYSSLGSKYRDWNLTDKTIEFRIFPGVEKVEDILFRTEIIRFIYNNRIIDALDRDNFSLAKDIIESKLDEIKTIIKIRYNDNTIPGIVERLKEYYKID